MKAAVLHAPGQPMTLEDLEIAKPQRNEVLDAVNSTGWLPGMVVNGGKTASQWCLVAAMVAIGMKTHLKDIVSVGWKPVALMCAETAFLAALFYGLIQLKS